MLMCVGSGTTSSNNIHGQFCVANPLHISVNAGKGSKANTILPYSEYLRSTIIHIYVVAYPFLDRLFPDLAAGADALSKVDTVQHNFTGNATSAGQRSNITQASTSAYVNSGRTNGTIEQKFQLLKSTYADVLPGKKPVRMDTFVAQFYVWYQRHINAVLDHWVRLSNKGIKQPNQHRINIATLQSRAAKSGLGVAMQPLVAESESLRVSVVLDNVQMCTQYGQHT